jgi:hypothetical protein
MVSVPKETIEALTKAVDDHNTTLLALLHAIKNLVREIDR